MASGGSITTARSSYNERLYAAIRSGMFYWFKRTILGWKARDSTSVSRAALRGARRAYYHRKRLQGIPARDIFTPSHPNVKQAWRQATQARWGGSPYHIGSPAWIRREIARTEEQDGRA